MYTYDRTVWCKILCRRVDFIFPQLLTFEVASTALQMYVIALYTSSSRQLVGYDASMI